MRSQFTTIKGGGKKFRSTDIDAAIIEIADPIAPHFLEVAHPETVYTPQNFHGDLVTSAEGEPEVYKFWQEPKNFIVQQLLSSRSGIPENFRSRLIFQTTANVRPGFSGSPMVVNGQVVSIARSILYIDDELISSRGARDFFCAVNPNALSRFVHNALGINPQPLGYSPSHEP